MADIFPITQITEEPVVEPVAATTLELGDLPYMMYDKEEFDSTVKAFGGDTGKFVSSMVGVLQQDFPEQPDFITYQGLRDGTAPILDSFPDLAGLGPSERVFCGPIRRCRGSSRRSSGNTSFWITSCNRYTGCGCRICSRRESKRGHCG